MTGEREIRYEWLRPDELRAERARCPLVFLPVGPLEYHGPHLPIGTDALNAGRVAMQACRALGRGVVCPTIHAGVDREREPWQAAALGFAAGTKFEGMDFPTARWKSHYVADEVFAAVLAGGVEGLLANGYRAVVIVNGHGAESHLRTLHEACARYSRPPGVVVVTEFAFPSDADAAAAAGHADRFETSLMLHYAATAGGRRDGVDLAALPPRPTPIRYPDFSIVDGPGFTRTPPADRIVRADPRDATAEYGATLCARAAAKVVAAAEAALAATGAEGGGVPPGGPP